MELIEAIESRRSIRAFKPDPVPSDTLEKIITAAGKSPSYTNTQPWEVLVVTGAKKDGLSEVLYAMADADAAPKPDIPLPKSWPPAMEARSREHGARRLKALGVERDDARERKALRLLNFQFYGAPCVILLCLERQTPVWSLFDLGLFAQSLILVAHSLGFGACLQASIVNYPDAIREYLGLPQNKMMVLGISLGYPKPESKINSYRSSRVATTDFVTWF